MIVVKRKLSADLQAKLANVYFMAELASAMREHWSSVGEKTFRRK